MALSEKSCRPGSRNNYIHGLSVAIPLVTALLLFPISMQAAIPLQERNALIDLYNSTNGAIWINHTGWLGAAGTECSWYGVSCDTSQNFVQTLDLHTNLLIGSLPSSLGNLTNLEHLFLNKNQLSGSIPSSLGGLANLRSLNLGFNQLSGSLPSSLGNLTNLQVLYMEYNQLSGGLPSSLGNLTNLQELYLESNQLNGSIPSSLGNLANLQHLWLQYNHLSGNIPPEIGNLVNLVELYLNGNQLRGNMPTQLTNLVLLSSPSLSISYNALYTTDITLSNFLTSKQNGWQNTQTVVPTGVSAAAQSSSSILVSWTPIIYTGDTGRYEVWYSLTLGGPYTTLYGSTANKSLSSLTMTGLNPSTTYYIIVHTVTDPHAFNTNTVTSIDSPEVSDTTYAQSTIPVIVDTNPAGLSISVDSTTYTAPHTFNWVPGTSHTIATTTPQSGGSGIQYVWSNWSDLGAISHTVAPTNATTYTANFTTQYYLTTSAGTGGTVSPASAWYNSGQAVQIQATANSGYGFTGWTGSGSGSYTGTNNPATVTMNAPITETASFAPNVSVTIRTSPSGRSFTVDGAPYTTQQTFTWISGVSHTIATTTPQSGGTGTQYVWSDWNDLGAISHTVAPTSDTTYTASFTTQYLLTTTVSPTSGGTISANPTSTNGFYDSGTSVQLTATENSGFVFSSWSGSGSGSYTGTNNPATVTMNAPITETASFSSTSGITVTTNPAGLAFTVDGVPYTTTQVFIWAAGSSHTIATTSPQGSGGTQYVFANWSDAGAISHTITAPASPTTYTANFTIQYYLTTSAGTGGTVSPASAWYNSGQSVQIQATANTGYSFAAWNGSGSGSYTGTNNPATVTMNAPITETANFSPTIGITITTDPVGLSFTADGTIYTTAQTFTWVVGSSHTITANSPQGSGVMRYVFASWSDGGAVSHTVTVPASATTYTASFTTQYLLTAIASPTSGGTISANPASASGYYDSGTSVQLTATANSGYNFSNWSGDLAGSANPQSVVMSARRYVTANFQSTSCSGNISLSAGGAATASTAGTNTATQVGYATVNVNCGDVPYGTAVFSFKQNGVTVTEAGVPASPPTTLARVFIDWRSSVLAVPSQSNSGSININTGIAIANTGTAMANVTYTLRDVAGSVLTTGNGTIAAGGHFAKFIDQLSDVAPNFSLPSNFQSTTQFGTLEIAGDRSLSVLALRGTNNQRNDFLITTTPVADLTQSPGNSSIYFPQFVDGGGYTTSLVLLNTTSTTETGTLEIMDDNGDPLSVQPVGGTSGSSFPYSIQPNGAFRLQTDGAPINFNKGWVRLTPDTGTSTPVGSGIFAYNPVDMLLSESGIPSAVSTTHARIFADLSGSHNTGLAIANLAGTSADIAINAFQMDGVTAIGNSQSPLPLPAYGHDAKFTDQFITGLPAGFTGVLDIVSSTPFAALSIRSLLNERHDFMMTTFPIADASASAPSPIVYPQVADGGGYVTQFFFVSPIAASSADLSSWDDNGVPIPIVP